MFSSCRLLPRPLCLRAAIRLSEQQAAHAIDADDLSWESASSAREVPQSDPPLPTDPTIVHFGQIPLSARPRASDRPVGCPDWCIGVA